MATRDEATPGTAFVLPLFLTDEEGEIVVTIDEGGDVSLSGADNVAYDPGNSGLAATDVQAAIDEVAAGGLHTVVVDIDCSAGGSAEEDEVATVPAGSMLLSVVAQLTEAFNGDATTTFEVGVTGNTDAYIDPTDFDADGTLGAAGTVLSNIGGSNNDVKTAQFLAAETDIVATWTNTAAATAGTVRVIVTYYATPLVDTGA